MDDSSINFHDKVFLHFLPIFFEKWRKILPWKFTDESFLKYLWICKYFTDDSSVNFHYKFFLHYLKKIGKKWRKTLSWKFMDESSIKYLPIRKWTRRIQPWINSVRYMQCYALHCIAYCKKRQKLAVLFLAKTGQI